MHEYKKKKIMERCTNILNLLLMSYDNEKNHYYFQQISDSIKWLGYFSATDDNFYAGLESLEDLISNITD